jgi:putative CocE/NonD family hydrolase
MRGLPWRVRVARRLGRELPPARCGVAWIPRLEVPGADGVTLLTDHYVPLADEGRGTILVRTPYGRGFPWAHLYGVAFAEQGFHVLLQSCRGTGGSTGRWWEPFRHEAADGQATIAWLRGQDWFTGRLGTIGASYLGYVQLALAADPPPELKAAVVQVGISDPAAFVYPGGVFALTSVLSATAAAFSGRSTLRAVRAVLRLQLRFKRSSRILPLEKACREALGTTVPYLEEFLDHEDPAEAYWRQLQPDLSRWRVPTALQGGWYDAALDQTLAQYAALRAGGCEVSLLIGPWSHSSAFSKDGLVRVSRGALAWMTERLAAEPVAGEEPQPPVRVHVGGADQWRDLEAWPPHDGSQAWYLNGGGQLSRAAGDGDGSSSFRYDPADPTPSVGGQLTTPQAGPQDNGAIEARPDVLVFTSEPLQAPLDVLGPVRAELHLRASTGYAHVFVRLCDVDATSRSRNVTDGILRLASGDSGPQAITVPMSSTAHQFAPGHRLRLQVSGGAYPRFARSTGTGEPLATATRLVATDIEVYHDQARPSAVLLPAETAG